MEEAEKIGFIDVEINGKLVRIPVVKVKENSEEDDDIQ